MDIIKTIMNRFNISEGDARILFTNGKNDIMESMNEGASTSEIKELIISWFGDDKSFIGIFIKNN